MKWFLFIAALVIMSGAGSSAFAQKEKDSVIVKTIKIIDDKVISGNLEEDILINADFPGGCGDKANMPCCKKQMKKFHKKCGEKNFGGRHLALSHKLLILLPLGLFFLIFFIILVKLNREGFKLSDALAASGSVTMKKTTSTRPDPNDPSKMITQEMEEPVHQFSASKLIAFLTAVAAIIVIICVLTYYAYMMFRGLHVPRMGGLWVVIACLFIGMIPYAIKSLFKK